MPQMYPMNWIFMFLLFTLIFIFSINKIFYSPNNSSPSVQLNSLTLYSNSWKW